MASFFVLVDTSVFVSHLRGKDSGAFKELLLNDQVYLSDLVKLELLQSVRQNEGKQLNHVLGGLTPLPFHEAVMLEAERILAKAKGHGLALGIVDLLIAGQANLEKCPVYSFDEVFAKLARLRLVAVL